MKKHEHNLWNCAVAWAISERVKAFEGSVKARVPYPEFERSWKARLAAEYGHILAKKGWARYSERAGRFVLTPKAPEPLQKTAKKILAGKDVSKGEERRTLALALAGSVDAEDKLKRFPIQSNRPNSEPMIPQRIAFAMGSKPLPKPEEVKPCEKRKTNQKRRKAKPKASSASRSQAELFPS